MFSITTKWGYYIDPGITKPITKWLDDKNLRYTYDAVNVCRDQKLRRLTVYIPNNGAPIIDKAIEAKIKELYKECEN